MAMFKYRVKFETKVQVDGWTDFRDREYEKRSETVVVEAKNLADAKKVAVKAAYGYAVPVYWGTGYRSYWQLAEIKKIVRVKKKVCK